MTSVAQIIWATAEVYEIPLCRLSSPARGPGKVGTNNWQFSYPRQVAMYLAHQLTDHSRSRIGRFFGGRDHSTVSHAISEVERRLVNNPDLAQTIEKIKKMLAYTPEVIDVYALPKQLPAVARPYYGERKASERSDEERRIEEARCVIMRGFGLGPPVRVEDRVYRDPCFKCGVRGDIGCVHTRVAA